MKVRDLAGIKIKTFEILYRLPGSINPKWLCRCECGREKALFATRLKSENVRCICQPKFKQKYPLYSTWRGMINRCSNTTDPNYKNYGGRGITVCDRWSVYKYFEEDMGICPPFTSLDRIDNNKGYSPENCKWSTQKEKCSNMSKNKWYTYNGVTQIASEWARYLGISAEGFRKRIISNGISDACFSPDKVPYPIGRGRGKGKKNLALL